MDNHSIAVYV